LARPFNPRPLNKPARQFSRVVVVVAVYLGGRDEYGGENGARSTTPRAVVAGFSKRLTTLSSLSAEFDKSKRFHNTNHLQERRVAELHQVRRLC